MTDRRSPDESRDGLSLAVVAGLFVASLTLRPPVLAIGPLLPLIREDLGLPASLAGLLTTIPVLCMGLFAPFGPRVASRLGPRTAFAVSTGLIAAMGVVRVLAPTYPLVLLATFGIGIGIGIAGPIPSMVVARRLPARLSLGTGAYAAGITAGSALSAALAVPIAGSGGWRFSLLVMALVSFLAVGAWLALVRGDDDATRAASRAVRLPWRSGTAWVLAIVFGLQSVLFYGATAWLPNAFVERGWSPADAGGLVAASNGVALITVIGVPLVADRVRSRRPPILVACVVTVIALTLIAGAPELAYPAVVILGLALGSLLSLVLTVPLDVSDDPARVGSISALMLLGGYVISSTGPFLLGAARDLTGNFAASLWLLVLAAVGMTLMALAIPSREHQRAARVAVPPA